MTISEAKMQMVIANYFKDECDVNTSIRQAFEKGFRIGVKKGASTNRPQEWIPCSERLPETLGEYLITALSNPHKNRIVSAGYYNNRFKEFGTYRADASWEKWDVIAWMPLPNPWKGADDER